MSKNLACLLLSLLIAGACTYRGQVRQDIYQEPALAEKIQTSVLINPSQHIPQEVVLTDPDASDTQAFILLTKDGVLAAVQDAFSTSFQTVRQAAPGLENQADWTADVTVETGLTRNNCEGELAKWAVRREGLCTLVKLTLQRPGKNSSLVLKASRWSEFRTPGFASSVRWINKHTFILSPILTPIYMQSQGNALRKQFETNLAAALKDIISQLQAKRSVLEDASCKQTPAAAQNYVE